MASRIMQTLIQAPFGPLTLSLRYNVSVSLHKPLLKVAPPTQNFHACLRNVRPDLAGSELGQCTRLIIKW